MAAARLGSINLRKDLASALKVLHLGGEFLILSGRRFVARQERVATKAPALSVTLNTIGSIEMDKKEYTVLWPEKNCWDPRTWGTGSEIRRREREINTSQAASLYHTLYPRSNFFAKSMETQRQFEEVAKRLF